MFAQPRFANSVPDPILVPARYLTLYWYHLIIVSICGTVWYSMIVWVGAVWRINIRMVCGSYWMVWDSMASTEFSCYLFMTMLQSVIATKIFE